MFISIYHNFKSERIKGQYTIQLYQVLIRSIMTYPCPAWEFAVDSNVLKLQCLQNKVLRTIDNLPRHTDL